MSDASVHESEELGNSDWADKQMLWQRCFSTVNQACLQSEVAALSFFQLSTLGSSHSPKECIFGSSGDWISLRRSVRVNVVMSCDGLETFKVQYDDGWMDESIWQLLVGQPLNVICRCSLCHLCVTHSTAVMFYTTFPSLCLCRRRWCLSAAVTPDASWLSQIKEHAKCITSCLWQRIFFFSFFF